jgi:molybdopterin synthase catalytic subunit
MMVTADRIVLREVLHSVEDPEAGAVVLFLGTVRKMGEIGRVKEMTYEAYTPLAEKALLEIKREMMKKWPVGKVRIVHRVGRLRLKDISVAIAVSSEHRADAFEACRFAIERIKRDVPIWKREKLAEGTEVWVKGRKMAQ